MDAFLLVFGIIILFVLFVLAGAALGSVLSVFASAMMADLTTLYIQYIAKYGTNPEGLEMTFLKPAIILVVIAFILLFIHPISKVMGTVFLTSTTAAAFIPTTNFFPNATEKHIYIMTAAGLVVGLILGIVLASKEHTLLEHFDIEDLPFSLGLGSVLGAVYTALTVNVLYVFLKSLSIDDPISELDTIRSITSSANIFAIIAGVIFLIGSIIISFKKEKVI